MPVPAPLVRRVGHVISLAVFHLFYVAMHRKSPPTLSLILGLYAIAAIFLISVRDEIGTTNDQQFKAGGWIALMFAVYQTIRALLAWAAARSSAPAPVTTTASQPGGQSV